MALKTANIKAKTTIDPDEIARFSKDAADWWNPNGKFRPLHRLNPARLDYITGQIKRAEKTMKGLRLLDIGCGGGLVAEPMARLGANVTAIDGDKEAIRIATTHAAKHNISIDYRNCAVEDLSGEKFDCILALEIVEHVSDVEAFCGSIAAHLKPEGIAIFSTLNRTRLSYALGIVAAEKILRWVPEGTHDWNKFLTPDEMTGFIEESGLSVQDKKGLAFNPITRGFHLSDSLAVNYFITARK